MTVISLLDIASFLTVLVGLIVFITRGRAFSRDVRALFIGILALTLFRNFSNVLEWSGITTTVGLYEEYVEILTPLFWVFFFYALLRRKAEETQGLALERFRTVMDSLDAIVYVADMETYEVLFVNKYVRDIFGDIEGEPCWRSIQTGQTGPCDFCTNDKLVDGNGNSTGVYAWEFQNTVNNRWYDCRDQAIQWSGGRLVRMEIATDITDRKQAEEALRESEDRYRTVVENSSTCIYIRQGDKFRFVNNRMIEISGYSKEELLSMSIFDLVHPEDKETAGRQAAERDAGHKSEQTVQYRIVKKDGSSIWVESIGGTQVDYEGKPAVLSSYGEVTDRKLAEEALKESEGRYRTMVEAATDMIITFDLNSGVITNANAITEEMLGYRREDILGKVHFQELVHPDDHERALKNIHERTRDDKRYPNSPFRIRKSDGSYLHTEVNGALLYDSESNPNAYLALIRDVTDRKRAEKELNEARERLDSILEVAPIILWSLDADGIFLLSQGRGLESLGLESGEVVGQSVYDLYKDYPELIEMIRRSFAGEDFMGDTPVGGRHWHNRFIPNRNEEGDVIGLFGLSMDITERAEVEEERKRFEAQLQHTQKLESLGILAGGIAHDFNNLLTGILGNADLALLNLGQTSPARNNLGEIETAARRAAELCGQMLAYSGKGRFLVEALSINELVEEMAPLVEISISKKAVLRYDFADNLPAIEADATQMRQIVMNLITNASEAVGEMSGVISISTGAMECDEDYLAGTYLDEQLKEGVYVYIEVSDSGCGMDAETRKKIFDPFFTTKFTGRGLGLAAVLGIVRGHGGAIKVYSEPGKGTTFKALFPALDGPAATRRETDSQVEGWRGSGVALLVDDEETVRTVGKLMLEEMGFSVALAVDGRDGVEKFCERQDEIVVVLLDMTMPAMGGEEAFREIRRIDSNAAVILSSGYNEQEVTNRFAGKGLAGFIQKPYQYQALLEKIREVLAD